MTIKIFILFDPVISLIEINPKKIVKKKKSCIPKYIHCTSIYNSGKMGRGHTSIDK